MTTSTKKVWIPEISDERLAELFERIKPVVRMARTSTTTSKSGGGVTITTKTDPEGEWTSWPDGDRHYIEPVDLRDVSYIWDPAPIEKAEGLEDFRLITTHHTFGYHGLFKPSIAEVLAQIPEDIVDEVVAFEIVESPETASDLNRERVALNAGFHVAKTQLFTRKAS